MVLHMFGLRFHSHVSEEDKTRVMNTIRAFQGVVPDLVETHAGVNTSPRGKGYDFAVFMRFSNADALDAYQASDTHTAFLKWAVPLLEAVDLDLEVPDANKIADPVRFKS